MDLRFITPAYAVSPQIAPEDLVTLKAQGFDVVINNRPDSEIPPEFQHEAMAAAAAAAGLVYHALPATRPAINAEMAAMQADYAAQGAKVLAYCASGTRSSMIWALGQAGKLPADEILAATRQAGYDLAAMGLPLEG